MKIFSTICAICWLNNMLWKSYTPAHWRPNGLSGHSEITKEGVRNILFLSPTGTCPIRSLGSVAEVRAQTTMRRPFFLKLGGGCSKFLAVKIKITSIIILNHSKVLIQLQ